MKHLGKKILSALALMTVTLLAALPDPGLADGDLDEKKAVLPRYYDETARFFAGRDIPETSKLHAFTKTAFYQNYRSQINAGWGRFQKPNLEKMKAWWMEQGPKNPGRKILYPFSGPDIPNALAFFPGGETYHLFGLEKPGLIPVPQEMQDGRITAGLNGIKTSLGTIFHYNFFRTNSMKEELGNNSFNSITGLLMLFLSINGYEITDVRRVAIDSAGALVEGTDTDNRIDWENPPKSRRIPGVEISFRTYDNTLKNVGSIKRLRYFMLNVIDSALTKHSPNFIPYLKKEGPYFAIIKSASYLMHNDKFSQMRDAVLASCDFIVQDDSGVPLRFFGPGQWKVQVHGFYEKPIDLFSNRFQKDLREATKKFSTGKLPFSYGYHFKEGESNLQTAEKIKD